MPSAAPIVSVRDLVKCYGDVRAVDGVSFDVYGGEILVILGPSGCGKSTTLRTLAGLERPDSGEIVLNGKVVSDPGKGIFVPPEKRNTGMVFQSFAIWPHMTCGDQVALPLKVRGHPRQDRRERVRKMLEFVDLGGLEERNGTDLSGGQQQRLSLARALVYEPDLLLLDEPLSNLDAQLRQQMRVELKGLQAKLKATFLFVTHDQVEAMTLADRILVMRDGRIQQLGSPGELYKDPVNPFVHAFLGKSIHLDAERVDADGAAYARLADGCRLALPDAGAGSAEAADAGGQHTVGQDTVDQGARGQDAGVVPAGGRLMVGLRPEDLELAGVVREPQANEIVAAVRNVIYLGDRYELALETCGVEFVISMEDDSRVTGDEVLLRVKDGRLKVWPA